MAVARTLDELSDRGRTILLYTCCLSVFIVSMDGYAVSVALPAIGASIDAGVSQLQWVLSAYSLSTACFLMLAGSVADRIGRRRVFQLGLSMFTLGSLLSSLAPTAEVLIAARVLQGLGGSMLNPVALSIISNAFIQPGARARALGIWSSVIGVSMALGPPIGGLLVDLISWRAVFWLNIPIAITAIVLSARFIPESKARTHRRLDPPGQVLMILFLVGLNIALIQGGALGWDHPLVLGAFAVSGLSIAAFIWWENHTDEPLLAPAFFRSRSFSVAVISAVLAFISTTGILFSITLFLQNIRGLTPMQAGLMLLPLAVMVALSAPVSGRLVAAYGPAPSLMIAGAVMSLGGFLLTFLSGSTPLWYLGMTFAVYGVGFGIVNTPITNAAVSGLPRDQSGTAAAVTSTARQAGNSLGAAIFGSILIMGMGEPTHGDPARAWTPLWWIVTVVGLVILACGWFVRSHRSEQQSG